MTTVADRLTAIRHDLADIEDLAQWAYIDGFTPTTPNPDAPSVIPEPNQGDHIPGARDDIALGVYRAREAYTATAVHVGRTYLEVLAAALTITGRDTPPARTWPATGERPDLGELLATIEATRLGLTVIETFSNLPTPAHDQASGEYARLLAAARRALAIAQRAADRGWREISAYFLQGSADPDTQAVGHRCAICSLRERGNKTGKRCEICHKWWFRSDPNPARRTERPTHLDSTFGAEQAKARRAARGEGWGSEEFSACAQINVTPSMALACFGLEDKQIRATLTVVNEIASLDPETDPVELALAAGKAAIGLPYLLARHDIKVKSGINQATGRPWLPYNATLSALRARCKQLKTKAGAGPARRPSVAGA